MNPFGFIWNLFKKIYKFAASEQGQAVFKRILEIANIATPIVAELGQRYSSDSKLDDVLDAYKKYGVPVLTAYADDRVSVGNALLNLATTLLRKKLSGSDANLATNVLNTAVQIAVSNLRASEKE